MNLIAYATPFFAILIALELAWNKYKGSHFYRVNDSINSLSMGLLSTTSKLVLWDFGAAILTTTGQQYALWDMTTDSVAAWVFTFIGYDFLYYWYHRLCHERQLFWASHVAHHQSEEYNLTTALHQTSMSFIYSWLFFIPCFLAGVPGEIYFTVASANLLYQFWVHTRFIPKLGWLESVVVTPSNHRVHHGRNPAYIDKNYAGVFIIWDRLFGTFQEELNDDSVKYGISTPLNSWNPLLANLHVFRDMMNFSIQTNNLRDKAHVWVSRTRWQPADTINDVHDLSLPSKKALRTENSRPTISSDKKYDPPYSVSNKRYALTLMGVMLLWGSYYLIAFIDAPFSIRLIGFIVIVLSLL